MSGIEKIKLESFGKTYSVSIPEDKLLISHTPHASALSKPETIIEEKLINPINSQPLFEVAKGAKNAAVIIDDWGRSDPTQRKVAPIVIDHLNKAGIPDEKIIVVIARGLALAPPMEIIEETFGPEIMRRSVQKKISGIGKSENKFIGFTSYGTPVWIDSSVANSEFIVGIGSVFPSPWGGWSGGAKIITPGVSAPETIRHNHSMMVGVEPGKWTHPGILDREEIALMCNLKFLVNLVLTPDGEIAAVAAGEFRQTHRYMGKEFFNLYSVKIPESPDVVITTVDWWKGCRIPMDSLYGFVDQSLPNLGCIAEPGATVICIGNLPGGIWAGMREYMRTVYSLEDLAVLREEGGSLGFVAVMLGIMFKLSQLKYRMIMVVDGISDATLADMGFETAPSPDEALKMALSEYDENVKVAVLPALGCPNWPELIGR